MYQPKYSRYLINKFYEVYEDYPTDSINSVLSDISFQFTPQFFISEKDIYNAQKAEDILDALKFYPHKPFSMVQLRKGNDEQLGLCHFTPSEYRTWVYKKSEFDQIGYEYLAYPLEYIAEKVLKPYDDDLLFFIKTESSPPRFNKIHWIISGSNLQGYEFSNSDLEDGLMCLDKFLMEKDEYKNKYE